MTTEKKSKTSPESIVREIKRKTKRKFTAEEKIRIVLEGLRGEESITDLCRKEGIHPTMYYKWKSFEWSKNLLSVSNRLLGK
jgi:transposase